MKPFVPEKWIPLFLIVLAEKEPSKATVLQVFLKLRLAAFQDFVSIMLVLIPVIYDFFLVGLNLKRSHNLNDQQLHDSVWRLLRGCMMI